MILDLYHCIWFTSEPVSAVTASVDDDSCLCYWWEPFLLAEETGW